MKDQPETHLPQYVKFAQVIMGVLALFYILYIGKTIIVPVIFATILAILLNPMVSFLTNKGVNRLLAIILVIFFALILILSLVGFIGSQASMFSDAFPQLKEKVILAFKELQLWLAQRFNIDQVMVNSWLMKLKANGIDSIGGAAGATLGTIGGGLLMIFLLPVYVFMILFYKSLLLEFVSRLFHKESQKIAGDVLLNTKVLVQNYLVGLLIEAGLVATLNSVGLLILGVKYAILLGVIGAILNVIPYIGGIIAIALPMIIAFATDTPITALWVMLVYVVIQFIDNHYIIPQIVASKVKINGLVSIIVVLIGGELWGVAGMFLAIPLTAIVKVVFDRVPSLEALGFLLGDNVPHPAKLPKFLKKISKKTT